MPEETDKKLSMSLDELIKKRRSSQDKAKRPSGESQHPAHPDFRPRFGHPGAGIRGEHVNGGRGPQQGGGFRNGSFHNHQQAFTNTGLIMPNLGMPFGSFQGFPMHMGLQNGRLNGPQSLMGGPPFLPPILPPSNLNPDAAPFTPSDPTPLQPVAVPQARLEAVSGEVRVNFRKQDIVRISRDGNMVLDTKGIRGPAMFMALNAILKIVDVSISRSKNAQPEDGWSVSDGRSLTRYKDGMTIAGKGFEAKQRGRKILDAFGEVDPSAAAAATAASNAAAMAAGIFPKQQQGGGGNRNQGLHPQSCSKQQAADESKSGDELANSLQNGSGGKSPSERDRIRRLIAKGRYRPY